MNTVNKKIVILISNFRRVLNVVCFSDDNAGDYSEGQ